MIRAEFGFVPGAVLAAPRTEEFSYAKGEPTDAPKASGEEGQGEVEAMVQFCPDEELLMPAPCAMTAYFVFSHLAGNPPASTDSPTPTDLLGIFHNRSEISKTKFAKCKNIIWGLFAVL
jgi:hypothetical protein